MHLDLSPEQRSLQEQLREYFASLVTPAYVTEMAESEGGGVEYTRVLRKLGADGWLGLGWPKQYGGQDRTPIEQFIFFDEAMRAGVVLPFLTINSVGPALMQFGTDAQRKDILPRILRGEVHFAIGYTEPSAGTDLASLRTRAVRDGDDYVINGSKIFTSGAEYADYVWLAARTDPDAKKHKGISMFIVDTKLPGFRVAALHTVAGYRTNTTFYDDVRVPASMLVGRENEGWSQITTQLNHERIALMPVGLMGRLLDEVRRWAAATRRPDGRRVLDDAWVQSNLARVRAKLDVLKLLNWKQAWSMTRGNLNFAEASTVKVYGSELNVEGYQLLLEVVGEQGALQRESAAAILAGRLERMYKSSLILTFGGGTNEVQRDIIAMAGLMMPRSFR
jgi:alkylation response protein AidB-like acyl-CoA dehydrogenase